MKASRPRRPTAVAPVVMPVTVSSGNGLLRALLESIAERGAEARFEVDGGSMLPLIRPHDMVHVRAKAMSALGAGDVVAVRGLSETGILVHRVIERKGDNVLLKGDNRAYQDGYFGQDDVLGVVTRVERRGKSVWFGSGRPGQLVAFAVRHGLVWYFNRLYYGMRHGRACLKFALADSRLRQRKGCEGNE